MKTTIQEKKELEDRLDKIYYQLEALGKIVAVEKADILRISLASIESRDSINQSLAHINRTTEEFEKLFK